MDIRTAHKAARIFSEDGRTFSAAGRDYMKHRVYGMSAEAYGRAASAYERAAKIYADAGSPSSARIMQDAARTCWHNMEQARTLPRAAV